MFKFIHGIEPYYLNNDITVHVDILGYHTGRAEYID